MPSPTFAYSRKLDKKTKLGAEYDMMSRVGLLEATYT
jgi:hypothetical protein